MDKKTPIKIDLHIKLTTPEIKMCDCGEGPPHAFISAGNFRSMSFGSKYWGRGLLNSDEVEIFGDFIKNELLDQMNKLSLPEKGPQKIECSDYDEYAGREVLFEDD